MKSEEKRKDKNFSQKQGVGSSEGSLPLGEGGSRLRETDEGWDAVSSMNGRGGGMPRPHEFHTQKQSGVSLPACRGLCPAQRIRIYMTAGGSHTATTLAQRQLRLMRSKLSIIAMGWYDAVPFDLIRHGLWPVTPSPPGEGFRRCKPSAPTAPHPAALRPPSPGGKAISQKVEGFYADFCHSNTATWRAGHAPPLPSHAGRFFLPTGAAYKKKAPLLGLF